MTLGETMSRNSEEAAIGEWLAGLSAAEASQFTRVLQVYRAAGGGTSDGEMRALLALVRRYTAERVHQVIAQAATQGPLTIGQLQTVLSLEDPLLAQVVHLCETEHIAPVAADRTPLVSQMLTELVDEFDDLTWWQEAVRRAVRCNRRRLSTVERILRDRQETGSWERKAAENGGKRRGKASEAGRGVKEVRQTRERRGTPHWDADELARRRAQLPPEEWVEPPD
jgi:hypothetical protein